MKITLYILFFIATLCCNNQTASLKQKAIIDKEDTKANITIKDSLLYIDSFVLPIVIKYDSYKIDSSLGTQQNEIEIITFKFSNDKMKYNIEYTKLSNKSQDWSPTAFLNKSDHMSNHLHPSYTKVLHKAYLLNGTYKYLFIYFGPEYYISQLSYYKEKQYFQIEYLGSLKDSANTNKIMGKLFDSDFKLRR